MKRIHVFIGLLLTALCIFFNIRTSRAGAVTGYLDCISDGIINGWAWNPSSPERQLPIHLMIYSNDETNSLVKEITAYAGVYRADLSQLGYGDGTYGFHAGVDWSSLREGIYRIEAFAENTPLTNTLYYDTKTHRYSHSDPASKAMHYLGRFKSTAYCPCRSCCGSNGGTTSTGTTPAAGRTISVDPKVIPYGSKIMINNVVYTAEDCGGGINGNRVDIYFTSHSECLRYGVKNVDVFLLEE